VISNLEILKCRTKSELVGSRGRILLVHLTYHFVYLLKCFDGTGGTTKNRYENDNLCYVILFVIKRIESGFVFHEAK
jgi:hypothetical protein